MQHHVAPTCMLAIMASACGARTPLDMPSAGVVGGFGDAAVADDGGSAGDSAVDVDGGNHLPDSSFDFDAFDGGSPSDGPACGEDGACAIGSVCAGDLCIPCGEPGMACCAGGYCDPPANACLNHICVPMR